MITISNLSKKYGQTYAVRELTFGVAPGQALALWGPNGAGKTTVLKCLLGLLRFDGRITVAGFDVRTQGRSARRQLGYVPQEQAFYDELSALDTAYFFARLKETPVAQIAPILEQVGLTEHLHKTVGALSGGLRQRLALALSLLGDPPVLVLDEPTSNLDATARADLLHLLQEVRTAGKTILFTSHRLDEIEDLADQVLVMQAGQEQIICPAAQLASVMDLRSELKLHMSTSMLEQAMQLLQTGGYQAHRNGTGILVRVAENAKAAPIHLLSRAGIDVIDLEIESGRKR